MEDHQAKIEEFREKIQEYENVLFGINLFMQGISFVWGQNEEIAKLNRQHYEEARDRMEKAISEAKKLLEEAEHRPRAPFALYEFQFPPITGHPMLDEGTKRFKALSQSYDELFHDRPKNEPLTEEEYMQLYKMAANKINL